MREILAAFANHLWQSTALAIAVVLICVALRNHSPRLRYWLLLAASLKFLVPFSWLVAVGARVDTQLPLPVLSAMAVEHVSSAFAPASPALLSTARGPVAVAWPPLLASVWAAGFVCVLICRARQWWALHSVRRRAVEVPVPFPVPVLSAASILEPGVFGVFRPALLLPNGIEDKLPQDQFLAILDHERCHVRYRDNLTAALHMAVEALFWFHPLVWWLSARLVEERERHCDECVVSQGSGPDAYAQGILNVCRHYLASPLPCAAGVTGSDLKRRIGEIMTLRLSRPLTRAGKLGLAVAAGFSLCMPLIIGLLRAQTLPPPPAYGYEVATIRPSHASDNNSRIGPGPQGGLRAANVTVMQLLRVAYELQDFQFASVPDWAKSERFDVTFTPDRTEITLGPNMSRADFEGHMGRQRQRLQAVLRDRFNLVLHPDRRELPFFALVVSKGGHKLANSPSGTGPHMQTSPGSVTAKGIYMSMLTLRLGSLFGRHVSNDTGLDGPFDFQIQWPAVDASREATEVDRSAIMTALHEQLGLRLESRKGLVPVFVIEKIAKPSEN